jgi:hypothetical protein
MDGYKPSEANAEDPMSVGVHVTFGKFRTIHLGDATKNKRGIRQREAKERRERSRNAAPLPDGMELRLGDCRKVLADVSDNSVPLILTDPPYPDEADPLHIWLAEFAARTLIPGGSLICFTGHHRLIRTANMFEATGLRLTAKPRSLLGRPRSQSRRTEWRPRIDRGKPVLVHFCGELTIDVRSNQCFECIGNISILITASFGATLRKISVRHDVFEQFRVCAIGQA